MAACRFGSPDLVSSLSGNTAAPTFAFDASNVNYFGLAGSFTSNNGAVCSFPTRSVGLGRTSTYAITPIIITTSGTSPKTTSCSVLAPPSIIASSGGSTTYTGVECPSAIDNQFAPGTYTLRFNQPSVNGVPSIASQVFVVAAPTVVTDSVTASVLQPVTASAVPSSTVTVTNYTSTMTEIVSSGRIETVTSTVSAGITEACSSTTLSLLSSTTTQLSASTISSASSSASSPTASLVVSPNGACGGTTGQTCLGSTFGNCCSLYGYCGSTDTYCSSTEGCQSAFGNCLTPSAVSSSILPTSTSNFSPDGSCGEANGFICPGSSFGNCCSPYGYCGSTTAHCGAGCQIAFGTCNSTQPTQSTVTGTAPLPSSTLRVSLNGACGGTTGQTCLGSDFGNCCSEYGFCGKTNTYCAAGCQPTFGTCTSPGTGSSNRRFVAAGKGLEKRAVGGAGPDYTYPPVPHTTVTVGATQVVTVTPAGGVKITTVLGVTTTTLATGGVVTVTGVVGATGSGCTVA